MKSEKIAIFRNDGVLLHGVIFIGAMSVGGSYEQTRKTWSCAYRWRICVSRYASVSFTVSVWQVGVRARRTCHGAVCSSIVVVSVRSDSSFPLISSRDSNISAGRLARVFFILLHESTVQLFRRYEKLTPYYFLLTAVFASSRA